MSLRMERHGDVVRLRMASAGSRAFGMSVSAYVIDGVMIDTGFHHARRELSAAVRSLGVRGVIVTHWHEDHAGNVPMLASFGLPILIRPDTAEILAARPFIQFYRRLVWGRPPRLIAPAAAFDPGDLQCIHTPGHAEDHQVVWHPATRTLFSGDLWLGVRARVVHTSENPYQILDSLRVALALEPERMFDAHRGLVSAPMNAIRAKIDWLGGTLEEIAQRVVQGWSDREIVKQVLGGEELTGYASHGDYSRRNLVRAVRQSHRRSG